jgi:hypothetical protein
MLTHQGRVELPNRWTIHVLPHGPVHAVGLGGGYSAASCTFGVGMAVVCLRVALVSRKDKPLLGGHGHVRWLIS